MGTFFYWGTTPNAPLLLFSCSGKAPNHAPLGAPPARATCVGPSDLSSTRIERVAIERSRQLEAALREREPRVDDVIRERYPRTARVQREGHSA